MADRSAWWRTGAGIAAWLVLAVATAAVAWTAVGVVADEGDGPVSVAVPGSTRTTGSTPSEPESTDAAPSTPTSPAASDSDDEESSPNRSSRVLTSPGGTVSVACTGSGGIRLIYATVADGWRQTVEESGPDEVEVEFVRGEEDELRTRARCDSGAVEGEVDAD